jgi:chorismate synthase
MGNSIGKLFRISSFGESHGKLIGILVEGCPAGLDLSEAAIQTALNRRKPASIASTTRLEDDRVESFPE